MTKANFLISIAIAVVSISFWGLLNQPEMEPPWPSRIQGFSFSPMQAGHDPTKKKQPTEAEIEADLKLLADTTNAVRSYTVEGSQAKIPVLARKYGINVTLGAWISEDLKANEEQINTVIRLAKENYRNVIRVIVGNEVLLRNEITVKQLEEYLDRVRNALDIPVSTAEPWHIWLKNPDLTEHVDFIGTHMLPYWEGIHVDRAVDFVVEHMAMLENAFPDKPVVIAEVGWPSNGRIRRQAVASPANEATFLRRFIERAEQLGYIYYVMEAFDQPWKRVTEGAVGSYWGVYDVQRQPKFPFTSPIVEVPEWRLLSGISIAIALITFALLLIDSKTLKKGGRGFLASVAFIAATGAVWIIYSYSRQYLTITAIVVGGLMLLGLIGVVIVVLTEAHEWAEAIWSKGSRRAFDPVHVPDDMLPMVSVHVPAYNEPPDMMIETLNALAALDYPRFEVIVMDNNTKDPEVWQPVEQHCKSLGPRFKFFHEDPLAGYKAGALNYCLAKTDPAVEVVAVIDSDYVVTSNWLRDLVPQFSIPSVAIVQAPQDYSDDGENLFKAMCYAEYRGFFYIGMITRNERNAIIQHGTMTMVRKSVLEEVGRWAEWCITEDAELGLKIFEKGYEAQYISKSYGKGVMPDTFIDFKKQRYRWAYGAIQIMRHHGRTLRRGGRSSLTYGQRYHFIAGWLPWLADSINLIFTLAALCWSTAMIHNAAKFDPPLIILSSVPLTFFVFKIAKMFYIYRSRVKATMTQTIASALAGLSLSHTIAKAVIFGFMTKSLPFFRTPKIVKGRKFWHALQSAREEGLVGLALLLAAYSIYKQQGSETPDILVWVIVLLVQALPYVAAVIMSIISAFAPQPTKLVGTITAPLETASSDEPEISALSEEIPTDSTPS
ncbi:glycosyltransferase [Desulfopila sp. IMCC35006]|uniref:glycosyltransferase family 2 protein n=1 Tax=Desulfopila sp. IMCC35006 TaxID=2569542 RepID=UPI0010AB9517|nr:glycosyltransferase family 2 protein [Desulfopila sp. IMCC35006]TKB23227.1 glycosyltransferase [Desulfopila sp. IMCC35006]